MADGRFHHGRHAGVLVPLFSIPSRASWGVGEIADLPRFARWLESAGLDFVQLLPVNEMEEGQSSPYSAISAMAIDPVFIAIADMPEFAEAGGEGALQESERASLQAVRASRAVDFRAVRALKRHAFQLAFHVFRDRHYRANTARAAEFRAFRDREGWWLDDYSLFRALHDEHRACYWRDWEPELRDREPAALAHTRQRLADTILYYEYLQWLADEQWRRARRDCGRVGIFGDFPFMVGGHSADVWARQHQFRIDASVGVPPDAFSETGQDWGLPVYRWEVIEDDNYEWLRQRARRCTELYDGYRVDHLVGFYRTYVRERDGRKYFTPSEEAAQVAQGERLLEIFRAHGARIIAEDLGVVPDFVRDSLARLRIPGLKVLRWEREWHAAGQPFRRPVEYPQQSVAISGTHDTETLAEWWDGAEWRERNLCADIPGLREAGCNPDEPFNHRTRDALLLALFGAGSDFVIIPFQDLFGWRDRVNVPAVVNDENWTWRLPWPTDDLSVLPEARERAVFLRVLAEQSGRQA
jgi:4-alpha-glucanotransferase